MTWRNGEPAYPPGWKALSLRLREEAGWRCEACGVENGPGGRRLAVDHVNGVVGDERPENLLVPCSRCHMVKTNWPPWYSRGEVIERLWRWMENRTRQLWLPFEEG